MGLKNFLEINNIDNEALFVSFLESQWMRLSSLWDGFKETSKEEEKESYLQEERVQDDEAKMPVAPDDNANANLAQDMPEEDQNKDDESEDPVASVDNANANLAQEKPQDDNKVGAFQNPKGQIEEKKIPSIVGSRIDKIVIPNAKQGEFYEYNLDKELFEGDTTIKFEQIENLGLSFNQEELKISGTPNTSGVYRFKCKILTGEDKPTIIKDFELLINPDPRSLFKDIPTPTDVEYYKPDTDKEYIKVESKKEEDGAGGVIEVAQKDMVAASKRGRSHAHEGKARDDDFKLNYCAENGWYIMSVADGAGSAKYSREGSRIACETVVEFCKNQLENSEEFEASIKKYQSEESEENRKIVGDKLYSILIQAAFNAHKNIEEEAKNKGEVGKSYATTLLLSICKRFDFGWFVASFWVGDGAMGIYDKERNYLKVLGEPDGGEFAGQTRFLTMREIFFGGDSVYKRLRFSIEEDFTALILMSDGVSDPKFETDANLNRVEKWHVLWDEITKAVNLSDDNEESKNRLLDWLDFWSKGNHDDRTIAILY